MAAVSGPDALRCNASGSQQWQAQLATFTHASPSIRLLLRSVRSIGSKGEVCARQIIWESRRWREANVAASGVRAACRGGRLAARHGMRIRRTPQSAEAGSAGDHDHAAHHTVDHPVTAADNAAAAADGDQTPDHHHGARWSRRWIQWRQRQLNQTVGRRLEWNEADRAHGLAGSCRLISPPRAGSIE